MIKALSFMAKVILITFYSIWCIVMSLTFTPVVCLIFIPIMLLLDLADYEEGSYRNWHCTKNILGFSIFFLEPMFENFFSKHFY